ncbi:hypothetical protein BJ742DRAFT_677390 [Cladochytrium replicatum]|nr:hypothetical protein BJ742DRAFT_677390 [Cladochytrium replicatum]
MRVACVPEHFSIPLFTAAADRSLELACGEPIEIVVCPGGTGEMTQLLREGSIDVAIALTEGLVAALANEDDGPFRIVGTYVMSALKWSVAVAPELVPDPSKSDDERLDFLHGKKIGISRLGSGSHIIPYVIADKKGWLAKSNGPDSSASSPGTAPFDFVVCNNFAGLRSAVKETTADAFLWERFTTKPYYDSGELSYYTSIVPPWPAFMIAASKTVLAEKPERLSKLLQGISKAAAEFADPARRVESIDSVVGRLTYSRSDVEEWFVTVRFPKDVRKVSVGTILGCAEILREAGIARETNALDAKSRILGTAVAVVDE